MRRSTIALSLALFCSLALHGYQKIATWSVHSGGGRHADSPDSTWYAMAGCTKETNKLNRDVGETTAYARLYTLNRPNPVLELAITPAGTDNQMSYREIEDLTTWQPDSSSVTFRFPHAAISVSELDKFQPKLAGENEEDRVIENSK